MTNWKAGGEAWLPTLDAVGAEYSLPQDLLSRIAYQESHWIEAVIRGTRASRAGALGIMQLMPKFFLSVRVPLPFTDNDVRAQIKEAAGFLAGLYARFNDWDFAVAAYNAGAGNVEKYGGIPPFAETEQYVAAVKADVPGLNV